MEQAALGRIEMQYPAALLKVWRFADMESSRYALGFVRLDFAASHVEVTNGRILVRNRVEFDETFKSLAPVLLWSGSLQRVASVLLDKHKRNPGLKLVFENECWYAEDAENRIKLLTDNGIWPDTQAILDRAQSKHFAKLYLSLHQLRKVFAAYGAIGINGEEPALELSVPLDGSAIVRIGAGQGEMHGALMCMAFDKETAVEIVTVESSPKTEAAPQQVDVIYC